MEGGGASALGFGVYTGRPKHRWKYQAEKALLHQTLECFRLVRYYAPFKGQAGFGELDV
jgi:hypothetical protein